MSTFALLLVLAPDFFLSVFKPRDPAVDFAKTAEIGRNLLYFVAGYSLVDSTYIIFSSALKGAGDTRYVLGVMLVCGSLILVLPVYLAVAVFGAGVYLAWSFLALYVVACSLATLRRYLKGEWRSMRVIEHVPSPGAAMVEGPVVEG
jgi:MATE family multidrug resistance protein